MVINIQSSMKEDKNIEINDELITKYLTGEATPEEALALSDWLRSPANSVYYDEFELAWHRPRGIDKPVFEKEAAWNKIKKNIPKPSPTKTTYPAVLKIAASFLIVALAAYLIFDNTDDDIDPRRIVTTSSEPESVSLADNSKVTLYRYSSFDFPNEFDGNLREVELIKGQAFFSITSDKKRPFTVHTVAADIKVVGTAFNVVADQDSTTVSVKEGQVILYTKTDSIHIPGGWTGRVGTNSKRPIKDNAIENNVWSYATQTLVFSETPMKTVIRDLEKVYPYKISVTNENIKNCHLSATFENDSIDKIVNLIAETLNLTVKRDERIFTLEGQGCQ